MNSYLSRLRPDGLLILLFHGVVKEHCHGIRNYTRKHLQQDYFASVLKAFRGAGTALSMDEVVWHYQEQKPFPPNAFAVTFDDGFENNYSVAAPVLTDMNIPYTVYICTQFVDENMMSWIDQIEMCLENAYSGAIRLPWSDVTVPFQTEEERVRLLDNIRRNAKNDANLSLGGLVDSVFQQCGQKVVMQSNDPLDLKLTWKQVLALRDDDLCIIGGHTHTHAILSHCGDKELEEELSGSLAMLASKASILTHHYSYPEGKAHCFDDRTITKLQAHGIVCSPTAIDGVNNQTESLFHLKRVEIS